MAVIFSDNADSNASKIGKDFDIPVITRDLTGFYLQRGLTSTRYKDNPLIREEFDSETLNVLRPFNVQTIALGGYMSAVTKPLLISFLMVNVHPADLSILQNGKRRYTGDRAVIKAIQAREKELRATTHIVEPVIDGGKIFMVSNPIEVTLPDNFDYDNDRLVKEVADAYQSKLKEVGDWVIFPKTIEDIASGRYSWDERRNLYYDNKPIPNGLRLN